MKLAKVKKMLRAGPYIWHGHQIPIHFICDDGGTLCFTCTKAEWKQVVRAYFSPGYPCQDQWRIQAWAPNYEDPALLCDHCYNRIESAYAEDEAMQAPGP
jgi:hypothetical protein